MPDTDDEEYIPVEVVWYGVKDGVIEISRDTTAVAHTTTAQLDAAGHCDVTS
jgi:hypothetical protein